jgi:hypothetical protein
MSLTSYRAAPPRAGGVDWTAVRGNAGALGLPRRRFGGWIGRPGGDLLSRALRHSTMGAGEFHGRVRDGIGCRLPAMATRSSNPPPGRLPGKTVVRLAAAATGKRGRADPKGSHRGIAGRPSAAAHPRPPRVGVLVLRCVRVEPRQPTMAVCLRMISLRMIPLGMISMHGGR